MTLPPGILTRQLLQTFPQFVLCDPALNDVFLSWIDPTTNPSTQALLSYLQQNPASAQAAGDVLSPPDKPATTAVPLDAALAKAVATAVLPTGAWIVTQDAFKGISWTLQQGVPPGPVEPAPPSDGSWTLATRSPAGGIIHDSLAFDAGKRSFLLSLVNDQPRHLSLYVTFTRNGEPVVPAGWVSRLPAGTPASLESDQVKYLQFLLPGTAVGGIPLEAKPQSLSIPLPANADGMRLLAGGFGGTGFSPLPDAAGVLATAVLDFFVPLLVLKSGQSGTSVSRWFSNLISSPAILASLLSASALLTRGAADTPAMLAVLSTQLTGLLLGPELAELRQSAEKQLGNLPGKEYSCWQQFAPAGGWAAQLLDPVLRGGLNSWYWAVSTPSPVPLDLAPSTTLAVLLSVGPDPLRGCWPDTATRVRGTLTYGGGFTQQLEQPLPPPQSPDAVELAFGCVPAGGSVTCHAEVLTSDGTVVARAETTVPAKAVDGTRTLPVPLPVREIPVVIGPQTTYVLSSRLVVRSGAFVWDPSAPRSTATGLANNAAGSAPYLYSLDSLTAQAAELCLGYAWATANQGLPQCGGGQTLAVAHLVQNVGMAEPMDQASSLSCGLVDTPLLSYSNGSIDPRLPGSGGYYLDPREDAPCLRPVAFGGAPFPVPGSTSLARFLPQSRPQGLAVSPGGYAAVTSQASGLLQIVRMADAPLPDAEAPLALAFGGTGSRVGLLSSPVTVAAAPDETFIVLENGNARLQAFDVQGNPVPVFAGAATLALQPAPDPRYLDLAIAPDGMIYVLGTRNGGHTVDDYLLDIYQAGGSFLTRISGINGARIAIDLNQTLYTLDFDSQVGPDGITQPVLSAWRPR